MLVIFTSDITSSSIVSLSINCDIKKNIKLQIYLFNKRYLNKYYVQDRHKADVDLIHATNNITSLTAREKLERGLVNMIMKLKITTGLGQQKAKHRDPLLHDAADDVALERVLDAQRDAERP